jgi:hypothetical protein
VGNPFLLRYYKDIYNITMKNFTELITEAALELPQFSHPDLNSPRDPEGKFWKAVAAANEGGIPKSAYDKALRAAKDLYTYLTGLEGDEVVQARKSVSDAVGLLTKVADTATEGMSASDMRTMRNYIFMIQGIDSALKTKPWYKQAHVDIKAGYVPFRGSSKDLKIKYRMLLTCASPLSPGQIKDIYKAIPALSPLHSDYIAGIEVNKDLSAIAILFSNSQGYKR